MTIAPAPESSSTVFAGGIRYLRIIVRTPWLTPEDDLAVVLRSAVDGVGETRWLPRARSRQG